MSDPTLPSEPTTEAGRALLAERRKRGSLTRSQEQNYILAIEADAVAAERERLREELLPLILVNGYCQRCGFADGRHSPGCKIVALLAPQTKEKE
jgi:hypothetical protein